MPFIAMAIGSGLGLVKSIGVDGPKEARQRKLAAKTAAYSPWTNLQPQAVQEADPLGNALQFGSTAAGLYGATQSMESDQALKNAALMQMKTGKGRPNIALSVGGQGGSPWSLGAQNKLPQMSFPSGY